MIKKISILEIEYIAYRLAKKLMSWNEPIPDFSSRFPNVLESCLAIPFQSFSGRKLYKGLVGKAAVLFYLMIKNHPFLNGNKRIATASLLVFLHINDYWLDAKKRVEQAQVIANEEFNIVDKVWVFRFE